MQTQHFDIAQVMARMWVKQHTDPNEVAKALRYLRDHKSGPRFFHYLRTVVDEGRAVVRSGRTLDYYRQIEQVCQQHLSPYRDDPETMAKILGWAVRLMRYYRAEPSLVPPKAPPTPRPETEKQPPPVPPTERPRRIQDLEVGMVLTGTVRRLQPYGAFVDIGVGRDGLVHISELADRRVGRVEEVVSVGAKVTVRVKEVDVGRNRIGLSMKGMEQ